MSDAPAKQARNRDEHGRFLPGETGNPNGRPPAGESLADAIRAKMPADWRAEKLLKFIESDNEGVAIRALQEANDRTDGKPKQSIQGEGFTPILVQVIAPEPGCGTEDDQD